MSFGYLAVRVWLSFAKKDPDIVFGNWKLVNEYMASSLAYKEYDYQFHMVVTVGLEPTTPSM